MTIKQAFEYLASECGIGMKNPFIALRNLVEGFSKVANEVVDGGSAKDVSYDNDDSGLTADDVQEAIDELASEKLDLAGGTISGALVVEEDITGYRFKFVEPVLGGSINLYGRASTQESNIEFPNKSGTVALTSDIGNLKFYVTTLSDTIPANQNTSSGVSISDLTSGILTDSSRIKGISFFNGYPSFYMLIWYNNNVVLGDPSGVSASARTVNLPIVIMYQ